MFKTIAALAAPLLIFSGLLLAETVRQHAAPSPSADMVTVEQKIADADVLQLDKYNSTARPLQTSCPSGNIPCGRACCNSSSYPYEKCCVSQTGQSYCAAKCQ